MSLQTNISDTPFNQRSLLPPEEGVLNCHRQTNTPTDIATLLLNRPSGPRQWKLKTIKYGDFVLYRCYYPHRSNDLVSPVCGIFYLRYRLCTYRSANNSSLHHLPSPLASLPITNVRQSHSRSHPLAFLAISLPPTPSLLLAFSIFLAIDFLPVSSLSPLSSLPPPASLTPSSQDVHQGLTWKGRGGREQEGGINGER